MIKQADTQDSTKMQEHHAKKATKQDALELLREDHQQVKKLFDEFKKARKEETRLMIIATVCETLVVHAQIEEDIFYPAVRETLNVDAMLDGAEVEHMVAHNLIEDIGRMDEGEDRLCALFTVLAEYVTHHIKEEEEQLFPKVEDAKDLDLNKLGSQLAKHRQELLAQMEDSELLELEEEDEEIPSHAHHHKSHSGAHKLRPTRH